MNTALFESVQDKLLKSFKAKTVGEKVDQAPAFGEYMEGALGSEAEDIMSATGPMQKLMKDMGTTEIAPLRLISLTSNIPVVRNSDTRFLNLLESQRRFEVIKDYQFRIRQRDIGTHTSNVFNMDGDLPAVIQSSYSARTNTNTAVGESKKISMLASAIASQQEGVNLQNDQLSDAGVRIRKTESAMLLSNVEQVDEAVGLIPQLGGFINRSTLNTVAVVGGNFTEANLQEGVDTIRTNLGSGKQIVLWAPPSQIPVIENIMITRYPGRTFTDMAMQQEVMKRMVAFDVPWSVIYQPRPGNPIPVVYDDQLPAGTAIMFVYEPDMFPLLALFSLMGQAGGIMTLARPNTTLYDFLVVFTLFSLSDPVRVSRIVYTGLS
jgi:hypothetical protein